MKLIALLTVCAAILAFTAASAETKICADSNQLTLYEQDAPVFTYRYRDVPRKPYVMELYTPGGLNILRDAPHDHLHHHGLMMAIKVNDVNYWEESDAGGYQLHQEFTDVRVTPDTDASGDGFREQLYWRGPDDSAPTLTEFRSVHHSPLSNETARVLTWQSDFRLFSDREQTGRQRAAGRQQDSREPATLGGRIYHGLGMRFPEFMDEVGAFIMADDMTGAFDDGPHHLAQARWCAYTVAHDETPVTVAMFNCPDNPRPTLWFTMLQPFAYLSGTQDLMRDPMTLGPRETITMRYGVAAWDAVMDKSDIEAMYNTWAASLEN